MSITIPAFINKLNNYKFFEKKPQVAVAVSGGPDSMALLYLIKRWIETKKGEIIALIVNHRIREESDQESKYVSNIIKSMNINCKILSVKKNNVEKRNMEEARQNRYLEITNFCKRKNILHLFIAHHKNDNVETYINRKMAGSDFEGLQSIQENIIRNKINILRPLLPYTKKNIYDFNKKYKIAYIEDPSNTNLAYTRPAIRKFIDESNKNIINEINKEFDLIQKKIPYYKTMISESLLRVLISLDNNNIKVDYLCLLKLDNLIIEKIIKKIYKFFDKKNIILRSNKIQLMICSIKQKNFKSYNLGGMTITRRENFLIFTQ